MIARLLKPFRGPVFPKPTPDDHVRAGLRSALVRWQETGDFDALETAVRLQRILESSPHAGEVVELIVTRCGWCPPEKTDALTAFAARHALKITDGCCQACYPRLQRDMLRVLAEANGEAMP